jgi:hypothetical protein
MIISDLQHIESANNIEVQGGYSFDYYQRPYNVAGANAGAQAFGRNTKAFTSTDTLVIEGQFSGSSSSSSSETF